MTRKLSCVVLPSSFLHSHIFCNISICKWCCKHVQTINATSVYWLPPDASCHTNKIGYFVNWMQCKSALLNMFQMQWIHLRTNQLKCYITQSYVFIVQEVWMLDEKTLKLVLHAHLKSSSQSNEYHVSDLIAQWNCAKSLKDEMVNFTFQRNLICQRRASSVNISNIELFVTANIYFLI